MRIHAYASRTQYARHVKAVWRHLPDDLRGSILTPGMLAKVRPTDVVLVGGWSDIGQVRGRQIYVEHGAGQSYMGARESAGSRGYHGTTLHPERVIGYIAPRQDVADSWGRPAIAVGCPALDGVVRCPPGSGPPLATLTFHWDAGRLCAEAGSALGYWRAHLAQVVAHVRSCGFEPVGHWHPRNPTMRALWRSLGVTAVEDVGCVLQHTALLIVDNSSVAYEAAAVGVPTLLLNCPAYRRDVEHGLRFWSHVPGWQVDGLDGFVGLDLAAYVTDDLSRVERERAVGYCYEPGTLGHAGRLAADWITDLVCRTE